MEERDVYNRLTSPGLFFCMSDASSSLHHRVLMSNVANMLCNIVCFQILDSISVFWCRFQALRVTVDYCHSESSVVCWGK